MVSEVFIGVRLMTDHQAFYIELGRRIREVRQKNNLTQEALASLVLLTRTSVTNIEKGRQQVLVHTLVEIAAALKVLPDTLLPKAIPSTHPLDELLEGYSQEEQEWVKTVVDTTLGK